MILVSDFDNTLYAHDDEAAFAKNLAAVRKFRERPGNEFVLASGRSLASLGRVLPDFANYMKYVILDNGAVCAEAATGKLLLECSMPLATTFGHCANMC